MRRRYAVRIIAAVAGGAVLVTVASAGARPATRQTPRVGGKVVVGLHFEPPNLNPYLPVTMGGFSRAEVVDRVLQGAYSLNGRGDLVPNLIVGDPKVATRPFSLTYTIKTNAHWSDGRPITARDFWFTWRTLRKLSRTLPEEQRFAEGELIAKAKILARRRVRFVLRKPWGGWREFFFNILPWHALAGEDFNTVWRDRIDNPKTGRAISSGPFIFASWRRGSTLTLVRNPNYWGRKAYLGRLAFRAVATTGFSGEVRALLARKADVVTAATKRDIGDLAHNRQIRIKWGSTNAWEHLDFQLGAKGNPALKKSFVRRAIALAIDRKKLASRQSSELTPAAKTLQSALFGRRHPAYQPHWQRWSHRPPEANRLLRSKGCRRGPDGIFSCAGQRLSFRVLSTAGFPSRELEFAALAQQLRRIGIELRNNFALQPLALGTLLPQGDWDLALFAWVAGPDPVGWENVYGCKGRFNHQAYCNHQVTRLLRSASGALRTRRRWALANRADALIARDLPTLPLFVQSGVVAYDSRIRNISCCIGIAWNAENWWLARR